MRNKNNIRICTCTLRNDTMRICHNETFIDLYFVHLIILIVTNQYLSLDIYLPMVFKNNAL